MKLPLLFLLLLFSFSSFSQDTTAYKPGVLYRQGKFWKLDGRKLKTREIKAEINTVPAAAAYNKKVKKLQPIAVLSSLGGLACLLLNPRKVGQYPYRKDNGLMIPAVVLYGTGFYLFFRSITFQKKASNAYFEHHKIIY